MLCWMLCAYLFFFSSRRRHTRCALVTGVQTCALPIWLFMLPRFLVYHYPVPPHSAEDALWIERERRLLRIIINPTMIPTWVLGLKIGRASGREGVCQYV